MVPLEHYFLKLLSEYAIGQKGSCLGGGYAWVVALGLAGSR